MFLLFSCWRDSELMVVSNADDVFRGKYNFFSQLATVMLPEEENFLLLFRRETPLDNSVEFMRVRVKGHHIMLRWRTEGSRHWNYSWLLKAHYYSLNGKIKLENWTSGASIRPKLLLVQTKYPLDQIVSSIEDVCPFSWAVWTFHVSGEQKSRQIMTVYIDCICICGFSCVSLV